MTVHPLHEWAVCKCKGCDDVKLTWHNELRRFGKVMVMSPPRYRQDPNPVIEPEPVGSTIGSFANLVPNSFRVLAAGAHRVMDWAFATHPSPAASRSKESTIITSQMTAFEVFNCLVKEHGCLDISSELSPCAANPPTPCAGGTFGDIYRGSKRDGSAISIKCLRLHANSGLEPKHSKRAGRELYNWFKAKHRNVLELNGIALFNGQIAMISPWMDNGNLSQYAKSRPDVDRWALCIQVAEGLAYIHGIGMANILVSDDGVVKIGDFGNSVLEECSLRCTATTNVGGGTIRWMARELFVHQPDTPVDEDIKADVSGEHIGRMHKAYELVNQAVTEPEVDRNTRTDVYSLGMTILEVVSGRLPYHEYKSDLKVISALINHRLPTRPEQLSEEMMELQYASNYL
ncbi:kinase-like domain-containing protein [Rhizoctonia solani]|nr:kinase-like domain-containing protein [Rhizoctonia solani]